MRQSLATFRHTFIAVVLPGILMLASVTLARAAEKPSDFPGIEQVQASQTDILGELALKQPGGPSYEFFAKLLPPLRYVDANFRCYPIVLCAPSNKTKARLVSNGSSVNARARSLTWNHEQGTPA